MLAEGSPNSIFTELLSFHFHQTEVWFRLRSMEVFRVAASSPAR
jgi:hypothetical protein